jgi:hypothetical protein
MSRTLMKAITRCTNGTAQSVVAVAMSVAVVVVVVVAAGKVAVVVFEYGKGDGDFSPSPFRIWRLLLRKRDAVEVAD